MARHKVYTIDDILVRFSSQLLDICLHLDQKP